MGQPRKGESTEDFHARINERHRERMLTDPEYAAQRKASKAKSTPTPEVVERKKARERERRQKNSQDPVWRAAQSMRVRMSRYNLTQEQILAMQAEGCGICGAMENKSGRALHIDHDHECCPGNKSCGECVRGVLCYVDNIYFDRFMDSPRVIAYLQRTPAGRATLERFQEVA